MRNEKFKSMLQKFHEGTLDSKEEKSIEEFMEKYDIYNELLNQVEDEEQDDEIVNKKVLRRAQQKMFFRNAIVALSLVLVIIPLLTMFSVIYYGVGGESGKGNDIIKTIKIVTEMTDPNVLVDDDTVEHEIYPFYLNVTTHKYTFSDNERKYLGQDDYQFFLYNLYNKDSNYRNTNYSIDNIDRYFIHPDSKHELEDESSKIKLLPSGLPIEVNVSLSSVYSQDEVERIFKDYNITWFAIDTGVEASMNNDWDFNQTPAIGVPNKKNNENNISKTNQYESAIQKLRFLEVHEDLATSLTPYKDLKLDSRIEFLEKSKELNIYGLTITTTPEKIGDLGKMKETKNIRLLER